MHVGQPEIAALEPISQFQMIDSKQMQNRRLNIVDVDLPLRGCEPKLIRSADHRPGLNPAASHEKAERINVMIAPDFALFPHFAHRCAAELTTPNHQRPV